MSQSPFRHLYTRRQIIRTSAAAAALTLTSQLWRAQAQNKEITIGFIYVGPKDDFGWNQAHAEANVGLSGLDWVKTVEEESVPETVAVEESMRAMIEQDGATVIFPTSFGYYDPHVLKVAREYPEVQFFHAGGLYIEGVHPENVGTYFGYLDEGHYINGVLAGSMTKSNRLGFIAAKPIPLVLRNINSFTLGAKSVNPDISTQVIFTGDWALPVKEAEAANSMADQGIDVLTCHVDSPKIVIETAERRGLMSCGHNTSQAALAPNGYLTGAEYDWTSVYTQFAEDIQAGKTLMNGGIPHLIRGGIKEKFIKVSPWGSAASEEAKKAGEEALAQLQAGSLVIYKGPLKDNTGKEVVPAGAEYGQRAIELESMDYLVEGVIGSTSS
ncbi:BMP family ABC transporter substrate-binding protein [Synechococcus sp. Nb3U1]|uniref:BMP family ABC transporter substrate-binding protein n=1 Tax=Synechococcus sp. Nb3U1 TaxID=1914529 RepID=UPI001F42838F|nr:BMP family ABC transporter substrate-binding protein [Synechococcus sp. Nb3U1]MCF2971851.1 BMP family ABC transporter substrate-binding protein [Synechococcus sp. Nb3U1]